MGNRSSRSLVDEKLASLIEDNNNIISNLIEGGYTPDSEVVEIVTDLPSAVDIDVCIGTVMRWKSIREYFNRPIRIYAWSYNVVVEKYFLQLVQETDDVLLTVLPGELKGANRYA